MKTKKWNILYLEYISKEFKNWDEYFNTKMKLKYNFLKLIKKYHKDNRPIIECGCGTGKFSAYLAKLGFTSYAMDIEPEMVENAKKISNSISPFNQVNVIKGDIFKIPFNNNYFSIAHSSGVFEHFSDLEIEKLINEQLRVADTIIFSVPTKYFDKKMLGNERFLSKDEWRKIILKSNAKIVEESGYHYKKLRNRIFDIIKNPLNIFKPIALFVFVLQKKE